MKRLFTIAGFIFLFFLFPGSSHSQKFDTDFLFEWEPEGPMKRRELKIEDMVFVKSGCYEMGDRFGDGNPDEKPVHQVCVDDFYMGKTEVTQAKWREVMGNSPSSFKGCDDCPVENVSWNDIQEFINKLNQKTIPSIPLNKGGQRGIYRLPTEAEWEYAARSGGKRERYAGTSSEFELGDYAWYTANSGGKTHPVKQKRPNSLGLYDMSGNVWEWVQDTYKSNAYEQHSRNNPVYTGSSSVRVRRGGSWFNLPQFVRSADRNYYLRDFRDYGLGFRLAGSIK